MSDEVLLRRAAERASARPFYLASALQALAHAERLDDAELAARLGCDMDRLPALLLCRRPTGEGAMFRADVEAIADRFGVSAAGLAQMLRRADALVRLRETGQQRPGSVLAAARDRESRGPDGAFRDAGVRPFPPHPAPNPTLPSGDDDDRGGQGADR